MDEDVISYEKVLIFRKILNLHPQKRIELMENRDKRSRSLKMISGYTEVDKITKQLKSNNKDLINQFIKDKDDVSASTYLKYFNES